MMTNSEMRSRELELYCQLDSETKAFLVNIIDKFHLSARAYSRILKIARTIADLAGARFISRVHILEASQYRFYEEL